MIRLYSREGIENSGTRERYFWCSRCRTVGREEDFVIFFGGAASYCHECQKPLLSEVYTPSCDKSNYTIISSYPDRKPDPLVSRE